LRLAPVPPANLVRAADIAVTGDSIVA
jgi:hypothetical protein